MQRRLACALSGLAILGAGLLSCEQAASNGASGPAAVKDPAAQPERGKVVEGDAPAKPVAAADARPAAPADAKPEAIAPQAPEAAAPRAPGAAAPSMAAPGSPAPNAVPAAAPNTAVAAAAPSAAAAAPAEVAAAPAEAPAAAPAAPVANAESAKEGDDHFSMWLQSAKTLKVGDGVAEVVLVTQGDFHCNENYPYKFSLGSPSAGVSYPTPVVRRDAMSVTPTRSVMRIPFVASAPGDARISGKFSFSVCNSRQCVVDSRELAVNVKVQ